MNNNLPLGADNKNAPFNSTEIICPICGAYLETVDSGSYKGKTWYEYQCPDCQFNYSEEPDYGE